MINNMAKANKLFLALTLAALLFVGSAISLAVIAFLSVPDFTVLKHEVSVPIKLANGEKSTRLVGPETNSWVSLGNISNPMIMAVIAEEDSSFFSHKGVDYFELKESIKKDLKEKRWARGASTLTQQVIKNVFLNPEKSLGRKVKEVLWASQLEKVLTKSQILCFYLNMAEWGPGIYGIGNAARYYFQKAPADLSPKQAAFLAMLLPSPIRYHAYFQKKSLTKWASARVNHVLSVMNRMGYIDDSVTQIALHESLFGEAPDAGNAGNPSGDDIELKDEPPPPPEPPLPLPADDDPNKAPDGKDALPVPENSTTSDPD
jgi:monofunctional glycosyltransferase